MTDIILELKASARCKGCGTLTPLPGLRDVVACRTCTAPLVFALMAEDSRDGGLRYPFGGYYDALAEAALLLDVGAACNDARDSQGSPVELRRVAAPICAACETALPIPEPSTTTLACPGCHDDIAVRAPDEETERWDPRIACIVGDAKDRGAGPAEGSRDGAVVPCGQCGAPLAAPSMDDHRRTRRCGYCGASNFLSDAAWLALFPQPEWHRMYLVYRVDARALFGLHAWMAQEKGKYWLEKPREKALAVAMAAAFAAARPALVAAMDAGEATPAEIEALATDATLAVDEAEAVDRYLDAETREALGGRAAPTLIPRWAGASSAVLRALVAGHGGTPPATLDELAGDRDAAVRAVVAGRTDANPATIAKLRTDRDDEVARAARANPSYKPGFFERIFG